MIFSTDCSGCNFIEVFEKSCCWLIVALNIELYFAESIDSASFWSTTKDRILLFNHKCSW
jgi:hypothetical protein